MLRRGDDPRRQIVIEKCRGLRGQNLEVAFDGFDDALDFTRADNGIHLWNLFEDLVAIPFHPGSRRR